MKEFLKYIHYLWSYYEKFIVRLFEPWPANKCTDYQGGE